MRIVTRALTAACCLFVAVPVVRADSQSLPAATVVPSDLKWTLSSSGIYVSRIAGDSTKSGIYTLRSRFPAGLRIEPHSHPDDRVVIVLSGTVYFGYGDEFDETKLVALPAGSMWTEPAAQTHFAWARDGETVIQITGYGPSGNSPVRKK